MARKPNPRARSKPRPSSSASFVIEPMRTPTPEHHAMLTARCPVCAEGFAIGMRVHVLAVAPLVLVHAEVEDRPGFAFRDCYARAKRSGDIAGLVKWAPTT